MNTAQSVEKTAAAPAPISTAPCTAAQNVAVAKFLQMIGGALVVEIASFRKILFPGDLLVCKKIKKNNASGRIFELFPNFKKCMI
jgi:hypothetical protein